MKKILKILLSDNDEKSKLIGTFQRGSTLAESTFRGYRLKTASELER